MMPEHGTTLAGARRAAAVAALGAILVTGLASASPADETATVTVAEILAIARVEAPPPGTGLRVHADFPADDPYLLGGALPIRSLTARITPGGDAEIVSMVASPAEDGSGSDGLGECKDPTFAPTGATWKAEDMPLPWRFNAASRPRPLRADFTARSMTRSHRNWMAALNNCGEDEEVGYAAEYAGTTRRRVKYDGVNVIDFGKLGGDALAVTYVWYRDARALEADMRLARVDWMWTNLKSYERRYQIVNIVTHEVGHIIGLDDLGEPHGGLTMYMRAARGELLKTTLGKGDIRGARLLAP